ncbi:MAG: CPBP family intramembrane glutamic endopeptidase, partial [Spirochaetota bacterium]
MSDLTGTWEREGRNPIVGAFLLVLLTGSVYFVVQTAAQGVLVGIDAARGNVSSGEVVSDAYRNALLLIIMITQYGLMLAAPLLLIRRWHTRRLASYMRLRRLPWGGLVVGVVAALAIIPPAQLIADVLYEFFPGLRTLAERSSFLVEANEPREFALVFVAIALTPALCEEFLFRAYFQRTIERRMGGWWSVVVTGTLFALFHQQILTLPSLILVGLLLSYLYFAYGSPYPGVVAHLVYNGVQIVAANSAGGASGVEADSWSYAAFVAGAVVVLAAAVLIAERAR